MYLNLVCINFLAHVACIKDDLVAELMHILLYFIVTYHNYNKINVGEELIKIVILISNNVVGYEGIVHLQPCCKMTLLALKKLERRRLSHIVHVLLVRSPWIKTKILF